MRCFLIGLPGSGKTTLARQLGKRLNLPTVDADGVIEQRLGCSIRAFFDQHGEAAFRDIESEAIAELTRQPGAMVLATGGGAVLRPANRECLHTRGAVFYLHARPSVLMRRLHRDVKRPLLQGVDPLQRLRELYALRDPLYRETAHHVVEAGLLPSREVLRTIQAQLQLDYAVLPDGVSSPANTGLVC